MKSDSEQKTMRAKTFLKASKHLSEPATICAILVLLLNDHLFRRFYPGWLTGKLGDLAWLYFMPFVCAAVLAWIIPGSYSNQIKRVGIVSFAVVGLVFGLANLFQPVQLIAESVVGTITGQARIVRDPTDLAAMIIFFPAAKRWFSNSTLPRRLSPLTFLIIVIAGILSLANMAAPDYGISCLEIQDSTLLAQSAYTTFSSSDGGLTWVKTDRRIQKSYVEETSVFDFSDPNHPDIKYRVFPAKSIERSDDGGQNWKLDYSLSSDSSGEARMAYLATKRAGNPCFSAGPFDGLVEPTTGNAIFAMGLEGVLLRRNDGDWIWTPVGVYEHVEMYNPGVMAFLLKGEILQALAVALLCLSMLNTDWIHSKGHWILLGLAWLSFLASAIFLPPAILGGYGNYPKWAVLIVLVFLSLITAYVSFTGKGYASKYPNWIIFLLILGAVFLIPFALWTLNIIHDYRITQVLGFLSMMVAVWFENRLIIKRNQKDQ